MIRFYKASLTSSGTPARRHVNWAKKHIDSLASGDMSFDHENVEGFSTDGVTLHDVFVYDGRVLIYAFEKLASASVQSSYLRDFVFQYLFLADKGKGKVAERYREYRLEKPDFHTLTQPHCYGFLAQPIPQVAEILNSDIQLFRNSLPYFKQWKGGSYAELTYFAGSTQKGLQVVDYLLRVCVQDTKIQSKALRRNLCKKIFPSSLKPSSNATAICDMLLPFTADPCCLATVNGYRALHNEPIEPWGQHAAKAAEFICNSLDFSKVDYAFARDFLAKIGLEHEIPATFKRSQLATDLGM